MDSETRGSVAVRRVAWPVSIALHAPAVPAEGRRTRSIERNACQSLHPGARSMRFA